MGIHVKGLAFPPVTAKPHLTRKAKANVCTFLLQTRRRRGRRRQPTTDDDLSLELFFSKPLCNRTRHHPIMKKKDILSGRGKELMRRRRRCSLGGILVGIWNGQKEHNSYDLRLGLAPRRRAPLFVHDTNSDLSL